MVRRRRVWSDRLGLAVLLSLLVLNAFHFNVNTQVVYYREMIAAIFAVLWVWLRLTTARRPGPTPWQWQPGLLPLVLFPVLLALWSVLDSGVPLYGAALPGSTSEQLETTNLTLYVLRNASLYLPMVLYFAARGISAGEIRVLAFVAITVAPLSINAYLQTSGLGSLASLSQIAGLGGSGISYNSYVPYLGFLAVGGIYLLFERVRWFIKAIALACLAVVSVFVLFSTSRQTTVFLILSAMVFLLLTKRGARRKRSYMALVVGGAAVVAAFSYFTTGVELSERFQQRIGSVSGLVDDAETNRLGIARDGLALLGPGEFVIGAGLTSVITSGPHNDYVRWTQRVGVPLMVFGFLPFIVAFWRAYRRCRRADRGNATAVFILVAIGFTLYTSIFGYPREDAYQAVVVYLGLALWFGSRRDAFLSAAHEAQQAKAA